MVLPFERLTPERRVSFLRVWHRLPRHLREITFDLHSPEWTPATVEELGDVLCEFPGAFSISKTDFDSCSTMPFETSVQEGSAPVTSRPHRVTSHGHIASTRFWPKRWTPPSISTSLPV